MTDAAHTLADALAFRQGDWMRKALEARGMTAKEMAEYLDVEPATVSRWLNNKRKPNKQTLRLWAMRTGVPLVYLETGLIPGEQPPGGRVDSSAASDHAALAQSAERFTRNDESNGIRDFTRRRWAA